MTEDIIFKRRNKLRKHFVNTSNVLLYGYKTLSGEAKITFQVIESFDWEDKETGDSKGYVFPASETLAEIRNASIRTIQRHIKELEGVELLTRQRRSHKASILIIEDVSEEEANKYLDKYVNKAKRGNFIEKPNDKNVVSLKGSQTTKMSFVYKEEENKKKEDEINVNENFKNSDNKKRSGTEGINDILKRIDTLKPPQSLKKGNTGKEKAKLTSDEKAKRDYFATQIATELNDEKSLGCYRVIAEKVPQHIIFELIASVKETWKDGKIKKSRGALFVDLIKNYCEKKNIKLHFSEQKTAFF